jgi:vanillate O-demethylase monooxygenase subunit
VTADAIRTDYRQDQTSGQVVTGEAFLQNSWYVAGWAAEFAQQGPFARTIVGKPLVIFRTPEGQFIALDDRCAHRWAPLSKGCVEGPTIRCMYHGVRFGADGRCVEIPGQTNVASSLQIRSYAIVERHKLIWVWMGRPDHADKGLIPDLSMLDQGWRRCYTGSLDYQAHHSLVSDNLLDFSHLSYLHAKTLGKPVERIDQSVANPTIRGGSEAKSLPRGVRVEGWISGPAARIAILPKNIPDGDLWSRVDYLVPGILISHAQMYPDGAADLARDLPPDGAIRPLTDAVSIQAVTPMTRRATRYFYSLCPASADMDNAEADEKWALTLEAFAEDLAMIEAQQRNIDTNPDQQMGIIGADRGLVFFRNLMRRLIEAETDNA